MILLDAIIDTMPNILTANASTVNDVFSWQNVFNIVLMSIVGGTGIYKIIESIVKKKLAQKELKIQTEQELKKENQKQEHNLELKMFEFDKEKFFSEQESNEKFQKEIINEIFSKFVSQTEWIHQLHDRSIENIEKDVDDLNKYVSDIYVQNDVLSNRIRNLENITIQNFNVLISKLEVLIKLLQKPTKTK